MHICLLCGAYPPTKDGIGDYTAKLADNLLKKDVRISVVTNNNFLLKDAVYKNDANFHIYPIADKWGVLDIMAIINLIRKENIKIIHLQYPSGGYKRTIALCLLPFLLRIFLKNIKTVATLHEFTIARPINRLRQILLILFSDRLVVTDESTYDYICRILPFCKAKIGVINIGSSIDVFDYSADDKQLFIKDLNIKPNTNIISFFGFIHPNKGLECLLEAVYKVMKKGFNIYLILISRLDETTNFYHRRIKRLIISLHLNNFIFLTGYKNPQDVSKYLSFSDICVLPFTDGVSLRRSTLIAAAIHKKAIISTLAIEHLPKDLIDKENILLVPVNDSEKMAEALISLCTNANLREKIAENMGKFAKKFSWDKIAESHISLYKTLEARR